MRNLDELGRVRHWILEIHLVDRAERLAGSMSVCCKVTQCGCSHDPDVLITTHSRESLACKGLGGLWEKSISRALEERDGWRRQWTADVIAAPLAR
jgi:hypothetical protein